MIWKKMKQMMMMLDSLDHAGVKPPVTNHSWTVNSMTTLMMMTMVAELKTQILSAVTGALTVAGAVVLR